MMTDVVVVVGVMVQQRCRFGVCRCAAFQAHPPCFPVPTHPHCLGWAKGGCEWRSNDRAAPSARPSTLALPPLFLPPPVCFESHLAVL